MNLVLGLSLVLLAQELPGDMGSAGVQTRFAEPSVHSTGVVPWMGSSPWAWGTGSRGESLPLPPTSPNLRSPASQWAPPTMKTEGRTEGAVPGLGTAAYGPAGYPPGSAPPVATVSPPPSELLPRAGIGGTVAPSQKPFANYRPPSPVSPYMQLYQRPSASGLDNYNQFVRPLLEQHRVNQTINSEIRGVQSGIRLQNSAIQRLGKAAVSPQLQRTNAPEYFMNHQRYFPSHYR